MIAKYLFIDRDGTLIQEPADNFQVDKLHKFALENSVITALLSLQQAGYHLIMISNQDGLGTAHFPIDDFNPLQELLLQIFRSQGIEFEAVLICPHLPKENCLCRKPKIGLVSSYLHSHQIDLANSFVIGDRQTDLDLAHNMGIQGIRYHAQSNHWQQIADTLCQPNRHATVQRQTKETAISVTVWLDSSGENDIHSGIRFFDHMLDQIATHANIRLKIQANGDIDIDDHHTIEDVGLALGEALNLALGDKRGIARFGFMLPMDETLAQCALDLSGRPYLVFDADFRYRQVGDMSTQMVEHFFRSLAYRFGCTLHLRAVGSNDHHRVESLFKVFACTLRQAIQQEGYCLPSSKGVLS